MKSITSFVASYNAVSDLSLTRVLTLSYLTSVLLNCNHSSPLLCQLVHVSNSNVGEEVVFPSVLSVLSTWSS